MWALAVGGRTSGNHHPKQSVWSLYHPFYLLLLSALLFTPTLSLLLLLLLLLFLVFTLSTFKWNPLWASGNWWLELPKLTNVSGESLYIYYVQYCDHQKWWMMSCNVYICNIKNIYVLYTWRILKPVF